MVEAVAVFHWVLAIGWMSTANPSDHEPSRYTRGGTFGENYVACMQARDKYNNKNAWRIKNGMTSVARCHADNYFPLEYAGEPKRERGYAGPAIPMGGNSYSYSVYVPGQGYVSGWANVTQIK